MVYISYMPQNIKTLTKQLVIFYLTSFAFGGTAFALLYLVRPQDILVKDGILIGTYPLKIAMLGGIVGFIVIVISFKVVKYRLSRNDMFCEVEVFFKEKSVRVNSIIDTGNMLKDPITKESVIVVEKDILYDIIPYRILNNLSRITGGDTEDDFEIEDDNVEYISKFRVIPFTSLGRQNGLLLGFKADKVIIYIDSDEKEIKNVIIGISNHTLSKTNKYNALLGLEILDKESEKNEFIKSASK